MENLKVLIPNSPEWLAALDEISPHQAAMTRAVIAAAGTEQICGVCGDVPAADYDLPGVPLRGRLCDDCKIIQSSL